jgi:hypothetical protein
MSLTFLHVRFGDDFRLNFRLRKTDLTRRWVSKVRAAQRLGYPIDDPERFYGFNSRPQEQHRALIHINHQIDVINAYEPIIDRHLTQVNDQDTLNYLHNIFERYHGLLDQQQQNEFWRNSPADVRKALATLNTAVHRCELVARSDQKIAVITYYGLPKKHKLIPNDYDLIERDWKFGTVHICYVEIGKTLLDLSKDDDAYISDDAFKPYEYYSADFVMRFSDSDQTTNEIVESRMWKYYDNHREFFESRGFDKQHSALKMGIFPVADLDSEITQSEIINRIKVQPRVTDIWFS